MNKFLQLLSGAVVILLVIWFVVWNWQIPVDKIQLLVIIIFLIFVGIIIFVLGIVGDKSRFRKDKSAFVSAFKNVQNIWSELTEDQETLSYTGIASLPKVYKSQYETMTIQAFVFVRNNSGRDKLLLYYCFETSDLIGVIPDPSITQQLTPFEGFNPFSEQSQVKDYKQGGTHIYFGDKQKKDAFDMKKEDFKPQQQGGENNG